MDHHFFGIRHPSSGGVSNEVWHEKSFGPLRAIKRTCLCPLTNIYWYIDVYSLFVFWVCILDRIQGYIMRDIIGYHLSSMS